jgi:hypothetical protein
MFGVMPEIILPLLIVAAAAVIIVTTCALVFARHAQRETRALRLETERLRELGLKQFEQLHKLSSRLSELEDGKPECPASIADLLPTTSATTRNPASNSQPASGAAQRN